MVLDLKRKTFIRKREDKEPSKMVKIITKKPVKKVEPPKKVAPRKRTVKPVEVEEEIVPVEYEEVAEEEQVTGENTQELQDEMNEASTEKAEVNDINEDEVHEQKEPGEGADDFEQKLPETSESESETETIEDNSPEREKEEEVMPESSDDEALPVERPTDVDGRDKSEKSGASDAEGGRRGKLIVLIFILVFLLLIVSGFFYYLFFVFSPQMELKPAPTPALVSSPSPTVAAKSLSEYTVTVLNGSGIRGEAGRIADLLEEEGFEGIDTGNAETYDFEETVIRTKADMPSEVVVSIKDALEDLALEESKESLGEDAEFDIEITVGSKKVE